MTDKPFSAYEGEPCWRVPTGGMRKSPGVVNILGPLQMMLFMSMPAMRATMLSGIYCAGHAFWRQMQPTVKAS